MQIVLLSGGSGTRLWPLSNSVRSKQFIKLFKNESGKYESMVQRVYRQISTVDSDAHVTIATSATQVSAIRNQLGDQVDICVEPTRRDTFPAIVLAAAYLHDELGVSEDECVAVCPVDPYVANSYYEGVHDLETLVNTGDANLTLMGIEPTYPSDKYGYIMPQSKEKVSQVSEFKEKPDVPTAEQYLRQGALWNAGVFAFKLGYLLHRAHELIDFDDYRDLYQNYGKCEKISFDYAVVEKEPSIQVMRYAGDWRDVGTWNMMAEVMADTTKGDVTLDDTCENVNVVNELDMPVLCMGLKNVVVAASSDGILVADKDASSHMKPYVERIGGDARVAEKSWGMYQVIDVEPDSLTIKVTLNAGHGMHYHSHERRDEVWSVLSGTGRTIIDGMEQIVRPGDVISIAAGCKHTLQAITDLKVIEVQVGDDIDVKDKQLWPLETDGVTAGSVDTEAR
ncbi:sugar phosphate nucleotidyltransferase [Bifidobacterium simiiventris]|uniref:sugar phosphate nucleotidyltransferase n=1 Tax=Bifidobacterium simiiventris TaxID=2834434 RepID=UPI001C59D418|nr:sugar phosphate nucleotidyltransferase [Bifidobacterium simiiventris]MBW3078672.1 cupin domain-containing protein [Bifidobacterium simiiventris]